MILIVIVIITLIKMKNIINKFQKIIALLFTSFLRQSEFSNLTQSDVDVNKTHWLVFIEE